MKRYVILSRFLLYCLLAWGILIPSAVCETVSLPPQPQVEFTKATVTWPKLSATSNLSFAVTYGKQITLCATVTPSRLASKFTWEDPDGALTVIAGTDPNCNGGQGGFLTIQARTNSVGSDCSISDRSVVAKLHGKVVSTTQGKILRPTGTAATLFFVSTGTTGQYGLISKWHVYVNSADSPAEVAPDFDGLMAAEDIDIISVSEECPTLPIEYGGGQIGLPPFPHNALDDENISLHSVPLPNCHYVLRQSFKIGNCKTSDNLIDYSFNSDSALTITRGDGNKPATPTTTP